MASNGGLASNHATVTINVTETVPVARGDTYTVPEDPTLDTLQHSVLLNDTDADGDSLGATRVTNSGPSHGTLTWSRQRPVHLQPHPGFSGTDTFQYEAWDGLAVQPAGHRHDQRQQPAADGAGRLVHHSRRPHDHRGRFRRARHGHRPLRVQPDRESRAPLPSNGSLTLNSDGSFTYAPNAGPPVSDSFTFWAYDTLQYSNTATVTLNVEDTPPSTGTAQPDGATYTYAVQPGGSTSWTAAARRALGRNRPLRLQPHRDGGYRTLRGTLLLNSDGSFTYTPNAGFTGPDTFTYTVSDGVYTSAPATVDINVDNHELPVADTGAAYTYAVPPDQVLTTSSSDGVLSRATDPYGYSLTVEPDPSHDDGGTTNADGSFTYTTVHSTLTVNPDGSFTYTPHVGFNGTDTFTYLVSDGLNDSTDGHLHDPRRQHRARPRPTPARRTATPSSPARP